MKIKNILMCSLLLAGLSSCNDYLDVDAPSKVTDKQVFSSTEEADRLLNAVYQSTCSGSTYGNAYLTTFNLNSDVEFSTSSAEEQSVATTTGSSLTVRQMVAVSRAPGMRLTRLSSVPTTL